MNTPNTPHTPHARIHTPITLEATADRFVFAIQYCLALPQDRETWDAIWQCWDLTGKSFLAYVEERRQLLHPKSQVTT